MLSIVGIGLIFYKGFCMFGDGDMELDGRIFRRFVIPFLFCALGVPAGAWALVGGFVWFLVKRSNSG